MYRTLFLLLLLTLPLWAQTPPATPTPVVSPITAIPGTELWSLTEVHDSTWSIRSAACDSFFVVWAWMPGATKNTMWTSFRRASSQKEVLRLTDEFAWDIESGFLANGQLAYYKTRKNRIGHADLMIRIYSTKDWSVLKTFTGADLVDLRMLESQTGTMLALETQKGKPATFDSKIALYSLPDLKLLKELPTESVAASEFAFTAGDKLFQRQVTHGAYQSAAVVVTWFELPTLKPLCKLVGNIADRKFPFTFVMEEGVTAIPTGTATDAIRASCDTLRFPYHQVALAPDGKWLAQVIRPFGKRERSGAVTGAAEVVALSLPDGKELWRKSLENVGSATLDIVDGGSKLALISTLPGYDAGWRNDSTLYTTTLALMDAKGGFTLIKEVPVMNVEPLPGITIWPVEKLAVVAGTSRSAGMAAWVAASRVEVQGLDGRGVFTASAPRGDIRMDFAGPYYMISVMEAGAVAGQRVGGFSFGKRK